MERAELDERLRSARQIAPRTPLSPCGRTYHLRRQMSGERFSPSHPSYDLAALDHLLPQGEKGTGAHSNKNLSPSQKPPIHSCAFPSSGSPVATVSCGREPAPPPCGKRSRAAGEGAPRSPSGQYGPDVPVGHATRVRSGRKWPHGMRGREAGAHLQERRTGGCGIAVTLPDERCRSRPSSRTFDPSASCAGTMFHGQRQGDGFGQA